MTPNPSIVKRDIPLEDIVGIMVKKQIELVPVVEDDDGKNLEEKDDVLHNRIFNQ